ncbi:MAG: dihydrofolate reductase family protein [Solirubrobacterales bacterium]
MGKLIYANNCSLDGFIEDANGSLEFSEPDSEVHQFWNDMLRQTGTQVYGRRLYEAMAVWETMPVEDEPEVMREFAEIWRGRDKLVYSRSLEAVSSARTTLEREFNPDQIRALKAGDEDLVIGGPGLAAAAFTAGLVDEIGLMILPVALGGGKPALPTGQQVDLHLVDERRFRSGAVYLRYAVNMSDSKNLRMTKFS